MLDRPSAKRRRQHAAENEWNEVLELRGSKLGKEGGGRGNRDEELGGIDRAHGLARGVPGADQRRGRYGSPAAAAARVQKSRDKSERDDPTGGGSGRNRDPHRSPENVESHEQQISVDPAASGGDLKVR